MYQQKPEDKAALIEAKGIFHFFWTIPLGIFMICRIPLFLCHDVQ